MIKLSNENYWHDTSILRATQAWQQESKTEKQLSDEYKILLIQINKELGDLYAKYGVEGLLNFADLQKQLTAQELVQYRTVINQLIVQYRETLDEELLLDMEKLSERTQLSILDAMVTIVGAHILLVTSKSIQMLSKSLSETYAYTYNHILYDSHRKIGFILPFEKVTRTKIAKTVYSDWSGDDFITALKHARYGLTREVKKTIVKGIRRNESYQKVVKNLNNLVSGGKGYKRTRNVLRGETARVVAESTAQALEQAGLEQYEFIATLDDRTTQICRDLDGKVFYIKDMEVGKNCNPMHFGCRSTVAGYFPEDDLSELQRIARDPNTQQNYKINASMSYTEWDKKFNK